MTRSESVSTSPGPTVREESVITLGAVRALLRMHSAEEAVGVLIGFVGALGGHTVPAHADDPDAIPVDLSFGEGEPLLAAAPAGSTQRARLEALLPRIVEDARVAINRVRSTQQLSTDSTVDPLSGLLNRRGIDRVLHRIQPGDAVVFIDLDRFKQVNDTYGHDTGDAVLREYSRAVRGELRVFDFAARPGGDEFVFVMPRTSAVDAASAVERIREAWTRARKYDVGFSAGIADARRGGPQAVKSADRALYRAKEAGRDQTVIASEGEHDGAPTD